MSKPLPNHEVGKKGTKNASHKNLRVALVVPGASELVLDRFVLLCDYLASFNIEPIIVTDPAGASLKWPGDLLVCPVPRTGKFERIPSGNKTAWFLHNLLETLRFTMVLRRVRCDVLQTGSPLLVVLSKILVRRTRVLYAPIAPFPLEKDYSLSHTLLRRAWTWLMSLAVSESTLVFCSSYFMRDHVTGVAGHLEKIRVVRYGVDTSVFSPKKRRRTLGSDFRVVYVGRIAPVKDIETLIYAMELVLEESGIPAKLLIAGPDEGRSSNGRASPYYEKLRKIVSELRLNEPVTFLGPIQQAELSNLLANCDLLVLPSKSEAFGKVIIEAMASGIPVVGSRTGGIREIIEESGAGFTFRVGDFRVLAEDIVKLATNSDLWQDLSTKALEAVEVNYSFSSYAKAMASLYLEVAGFDHKS